MADDKLYEESNESLSDKFLDAASEVVAAGAAAASFYRMGGARYISRQYGRYEREIRRAQNEISKLDYAHINKRSIKELLGKNGTLRTSWKKYTPGADKANISIRPGTTGELFHRYLTNEIIEDSTVKALEFQEHVVKPIAEAAERQIAEAEKVTRVTKAEKQAIQGFVKMAARHYKKEEQVASHDFAFQYFVDKNPALLNHNRKFVDTIIENAIKQNKEFEKNKHKLKKKDGPMAKVQENIIQAILDRNKRTKTETVRDTVLGDRAVTLREMLAEENKDKFAHSAVIEVVDKNNKKQTVDMLDALRTMMERMKKSNEKLYNDLLDVRFDPYLRTNGNEFYSFMPVADLKSKIVRDLSSTMPAKILKLRSFDMAGRTPLYHVFKAGTKNMRLAAYEMAKDKEHTDHKGILQNNYYYIDGKVYSYDLKNDKLSEELKDLGRVAPVSTRFGTEADLLDEMYGLNPYHENDPGSLSAKLGLNDTIETRFTERIENILRGNKNKYNAKTILEDLKDPLKMETPTKRYANMIRINELLQSHSGMLSQSQIHAIHDAFSTMYPDGTEKFFGSDDAKALVNFLENDIQSDQERTRALFDTIQSLQDSPREILSPYLRKTIDGLFRDQFKAENSAEIIESTEVAYNKGAKIGLDLRTQLQKGLQQEFILRFTNEVTGRDDPMTAIKEVIEITEMSDRDAQKAKNFAYAALVERKTRGMFHNGATNSVLWQDGTDPREIMADVEYMENLSLGRFDSAGAQDATKTIHDFAKDYSGTLNIANRDSSLDVKKEFVEGDYTLISESAGPMSIIRSINEAIKQGSAEPLKDEVLDIWHQLKAGRDDPENVSRLTMVPYFFLHRLADNEMLSFLQFTNEEKKSSFGMMKGLAKRLGGIAVGATYLDWANDTVGAVAGVSPAAGFINSLDYMDIGVRKLFDTVGIGSFLSNQMEANPVAQYWFGKDGYYDADQQREQYANGYEPVRRGRWWDFGSVNEFRGAQIQYYEPTLTRRLNSDYYDKSLYNGYWDKWGHSLLPTPTAPFSPLVYLMDPYYLENEHSEDRPYPVSGTMFAKDTPWGIVLNPTIGQLVKPVQRLHQDRLTDDGKDAKAIIYGINKHIRDVASGDHAYAMVFDREQITAGEYTSYTNPDMGEYVIDIGRDKGQEMRQKQIETLGNGPMELERREMLYEPSGSYGGGGGFLSGLFGGGSGDGIGSAPGAASVSANSGSGGGEGFLGIGGSSGGGSSPLDLLGQTNRRIYQAAARNSNTGGVLTNDRIRHFRLDDVLMADDSRELIGEGTNANLGDQASRSFRLISGIYGYGANRAFGFGEYDGRQIADSGDIDSFSRSFWDEALGGIGGGASEIGRRFIPEYRRNIRYNPLLNNQPDWLPEQFHFGDPYANLPRGEARLPGKGYEALNQLHPDKYGRHVCRIKNARIAGNSLELCLPITRSNAA